MPGSNRQRDLAKRRAERQVVRRREAAARQRRQRFIIGGSGLGVLALLLVIFLVINNNDDATEPSDAANASPSAPASESPSAAASPDNRPVACGGTAPDAPAVQKFDKEPAMSIDKTKKYVATIKTSCGDVVVDMLADKAPITVNSFNFLAGKKYFDGSPCHRMITGADSILQCGDPTGTGSGGPGYEIKDENLPAAGADGSTVYPAGTLAMANGGANTGGSQFFFVIKDSPFGPNYTVFGKVTKGLDVLEKILALGEDGTSSAGGGAPKQKVFLETFAVAAG